MEVPVKRCPQHHGDLTGRRGSGFELATVWIGYRRDVKVVAIERGPSKSVHVAWRELLFLFSILVLLWLLVVPVVLGIEDNCPASGKGRVCMCQITRLEEEAAEYRGDGQILAIGQVHNVCRGHDDDGGVGSRLSLGLCEEP